MSDTVCLMGLHFPCRGNSGKINQNQDRKRCISNRKVQKCTKIHTLRGVCFLYKVDGLEKDLTDTRTQIGGLGKEIQIIKSNYVTEIGECRRTADGLDQRLTKVEGVCGRLDSFSDSLERIKGGLNRHVSELWSYVNGLNVTVSSQGNAIGRIENVHLVKVQSNVNQLNSSLVSLAKEFHDFRELDFQGETQLTDYVDPAFRPVVGLRGQVDAKNRSRKEFRILLPRDPLANKGVLCL